jgi:hypothetical protein
MGIIQDIKRQIKTLEEGSVHGAAGDNGRLALDVRNGVVVGSVADQEIPVPVRTAKITAIFNQADYPWDPNSAFAQTYVTANDTSDFGSPPEDLDILLPGVTSDSYLNVDNFRLKRGGGFTTGLAIGQLIYYIPTLQTSSTSTSDIYALDGYAVPWGPIAPCIRSNLFPIRLAWDGGADAISSNSYATYTYTAYDYCRHDLIYGTHLIPLYYSSGCISRPKGSLNSANGGVGIGSITGDSSPGCFEIVYAPETINFHMQDVLTDLIGGTATILTNSV